jgi:Family of unknown function (DUF6241)
LSIKTNLKEVINITKLIKNKTLIITLITLLFIATFVLTFLYYKEHKSGNLNAKENISEIEKIDKDLSSQSSNELKDDTYYSIENIYDILHRMSNSKIIAEDNQIWGRLPMDSNDIATLKNLIEKVEYTDRDYLLEVISRWENNDFSQVVDEHNYFWKKLGGTVGKAISIKE